MKKTLGIILVLAMVLAMPACARRNQPLNPTDGKILADLLTPDDIAPKLIYASPEESFYDHQTQLGWELFCAALSDSKEENVLISPLSIQLALCMTANGADGVTREEMERLLCGSYSLEYMNETLSSYVASLPTSEKVKLHMANSIWYRGGEYPIDVKEDFLENCAGYYGAQAYRTIFDQQAVSDINNWVSQHTDGMIPKLLESLDPDTAMCLINALCFDAAWDKKYEDSTVSKGDFYGRNGVSQAEFMYSEENRYLQLSNAVGFLKSYAGGKYSFAALLPQDMDVYQLVESLSAQELTAALQSPQNILVKAWLPKFSYEYSLDMNEMLIDLGMATAFDEDQADFSRMSDTALYISQVIHKTRIDVDQGGTKAAAATAVIVDECTAMIPEDFRTVRLDRPFVYLILDEYNVPLFIGVVNHLE